MTGWRIGYAAGPRELVDRMIRLQSHSTSGPPGICQKAALAALTGPIEPIHRMRDAFDRRRKAMVERLCRIPGVECPTPDGAFYTLPDVHSFFGRRRDGKPIDDAPALAEALLEDAKVAVVPGDAFGAPYAIRLSYACSEKDVLRGVERLSEFLGALR
jgi:aspartate/methionine/tyrosine aminotransferase